MAVFGLKKEGADCHRFRDLKLRKGDVIIVHNQSRPGSLLGASPGLKFTWF